MPPFNGSIALIRHPEQLENLWLAYWDTRHNHFDFVTAERLDNESFRDCLDREIAWTLHLRRNKDYIISSQARLHLNQPADPSDHADDDTTLGVEFYITDLYGKASRETIELSSQTRWLTSQEVLSGNTSEGKPVSPSLVTLLRRADVIAKHTS